MNLSQEVRRTAPDIVVYAPPSADTTLPITGNEHFLVEKLSERDYIAVWTQSSFEGEPDQHIVFSKSGDGGKTWSPPRTIAGNNPDPKTGKGMASWAFPLVSKSGRIYVLFSRHAGINDVFTHTTGEMVGICSDDRGETWSAEEIVPMRRSTWDNPDPAIPANWIIWQKPQRLSEGKYFSGITRWVSPAVRPPKPRPEWWAEAAVVDFVRFENVDDDVPPSQLRLSWFAQDKDALQVGLAGHPGVSCIQEPSLVKLPDGRLLCVMRTTLGSPYWSVSSDAGQTWSRPEPLRQFDDGPILPHPLSPCPIYPLNAENFVLLYHGHDGHFLDKGPGDTSDHRRPVCLARGAFRPDARQPVWFSDPWFFMDNGGISILRADLAMYASVTPEKDGITLWYPERKFFLLGKHIAEEMALSLPVRG